MPELTVLRMLMTLLRSRLADMRDDDRGSPTIETVLIAAGLAAAAIAAVTIIALKVTNKANNIPTGP